MNEINTSRGTAVKALAIIGFIITITFLVWAGVEGVKRSPAIFASLASIAKSIDDYRPINEISITTEKSIVNSNESLQINWTDMKQDGEYHFTYTCTDGIGLEVRNGDGALVPVACTDMLTLPKDVHGLFMSLTSSATRFTDVSFKVVFTPATDETTIEGETQITVVNALIPTKEDVAVTPSTIPEESEVVTPVTPIPTISPVVTPTPVTPTAPKPVPTIVTYPQSDPNGYIDLAVKTLGSGALINGVFTLTPNYSHTVKNAIKFDIKNIGTKTSDSWTFKTILPNGQIYTSDVQIALKPHEHVEFVLGFDLDSETKEKFVEIKNTVFVKNDTNAKNDSSVWTVAVAQ